MQGGERFGWSAIWSHTARVGTHSVHYERMEITHGARPGMGITLVSVLAGADIRTNFFQWSIGTSNPTPEISTALCDGDHILAVRPAV